MRFIKPLDTHRLEVIFERYEHIITLEDGCKIGGFGSAILEYASSKVQHPSIKVFGIDDVFVPHGTIKELHQKVQIDWLSLKNYIKLLRTT